MSENKRVTKKDEEIHSDMADEEVGTEASILVRALEYDNEPVGEENGNSRSVRSSWTNNSKVNKVD